jgi:hypothetical protein
VSGPTDQQLLAEARDLYGQDPVRPEAYVAAKRAFRGTQCCGGTTKGAAPGLVCRRCHRPLDDDEAIRIADEERDILRGLFGKLSYECW